MLEVTFTESAGGSLRYAKSLGTEIGGVTSAVVICDNGATSEEIQAAQRQAEAEHCRLRAEAIALEGNPRDVCCLPLALSMGDISADGFSHQRAPFLQGLICVNGPEFDHIGEEIMGHARESLERIQNAANRGEAIRCWYSDNPDEICGFYHLMTLVDDQADIRAIKLPSWVEYGSQLTMYNGWGEVDPGKLATFLPLEQRISTVLRRYFRSQWRALQEENAPLRAVLNGQLVSAGEELYDSYIRMELDRQLAKFHEARLIGDILGRHPLGIGDWWIARRIEAMIEAGYLKPVTEPGPNKPVYHRYLIKTNK